MNTLNESTLKFLKSEFKSSGIPIVQNENGREGVDFVVTSSNGAIHNIYLQTLDLDKERSIKISKQDLGALNDNLWIALVLVIDKTAQGLYLISSKALAESNSSIFINNESRFEHLSNWEIKVFTNGMVELSKFSLTNMIDKLKT